MTLSVYSVYDVKAKSYATPFFCLNEDVARRSFIDLCRDSRTLVAQHPDDFCLCFLGFFDQDSGELYRNPNEPKPVHFFTGTEARVAALKADQLDRELHLAADDSGKQ